MKLSLEPKVVMDFFQEMNAIPRESGNEKAISDYLLAFAKERNLEASCDELYNVIIRKPATAGYEDRPAVILQGHTDMVCEKGAGSTHDFSKDPIHHIVDGEWLHADNTTLGADNLIAVAMSLAILDSNDIPHGPLECLFTSNEETGMDGAMIVKGEDLHGQYLINLDTEEEGEFIVSCAGGCRMDLYLPVERVAPTFNSALHISIDGLLGGHSGIEIHKQRANAIQVLARALQSVTIPFEIAQFEGGTKHNAIPRNAEATILVDSAQVKAVEEAIEASIALIHKEYVPQDPDLSVSFRAVDMPKDVYSAAVAKQLLSFLFLAPHGVFGMSQSLPDLVETSNNLAIVTEQDGKLYILVSVRSSSATLLAFLRDKIALLATSLGLQADIQGSYPAWEYERGSHLEEQAVALYRELTGKEPNVTAIHAGLECGLLKSKLPNTQFISFGPNIEKAHTPQERMHLPSVANTYAFLLELLKRLV